MKSALGLIYPRATCHSDLRTNRESSGSAMSVRSAELSATSNHELSNHVLSQLPPETIVPSVKTHCALPKSLRGAAACAERPYMTGEKKRKLDIPGRNGTTIDGETPLDLIIAKCQSPRCSHATVTWSVDPLHGLWPSRQMRMPPAETFPSRISSPSNSS
jgi:hypothetical protein